MPEVIVRNGRVIIKTEAEDDAEFLSRALDQFGISHQIICFDGFYNAVQLDVTEVTEK